MRRTSLLAASVLLAWPLFAQAQQTHRYRYESSVRTSMEQTGGALDAIMGMMPGLTDQHVVTSAVFRVAVKDSARGKVYHVTIDSVTTNAGEMMENIRSTMASLGGEVGEVSNEMNGVIAQLMAPAAGATIRRFVRDDKVVFQNASLPINGMQIGVVIEALNALVPTARMTRARWNDSWVDSGAVSVGSAAPAGGVPGLRTKAYTRWRATGQDTLDAVISNSTEMRRDSLPTTATRAQQDSMARAMEAMASRFSMRSNATGTRKVILDANRLVKEDVQAMEITSNIDMGMAEMGTMTTLAKKTSHLVRLP